MQSTDVIVVGGGLAGLAAATELTDAGRQVVVIEQEPEQSLGGQAHWSFGGLFFVNSPEQRRMGVRDSHALALADWMGSAAFDRAEDLWPRRWAEAYVDFAAGEKRAWLHGMGMRWFPVVGWAERGGYGAIGHGNSVPRFHVTWGTGPGVLEPFVRRARAAQEKGLLQFAFRHRVDALLVENGRVCGVRGTRLADDPVERGKPSSRDAAGDFEWRAQAVIVASGGIGGNHELVRKNWPQERLGSPPAHVLCGVPAHVDGRMLGISEAAGARLINRDRMWHYVEGIENWNPIWPDHAIRILPGPSSLWLDARGQRLPGPLWPGFDTLGTLEYLRRTGYDYSWFVLNQSIIRREFALSGSEQNPDLTGKSWRQVVKRAVGKQAPAPVEAFKRHGRDFVVRDNLDDLVAGMNALAGNSLIDAARLREEILARDRQFDHPYAKDGQVVAIHNARRYCGDRLVRVAKPHRMLDPAHGPLIAVRLNILTRKTLGGLETDLQARVLAHDGQPLPGLYAAGEAAGFGGGGLHGYRALEGSFLGGCLFSGRVAGRAAAAAIA
ncbi:FAD-binding dehydrogenase [Dyella mobilis]|uniref:FAD-binding dehydrogenase n=1 Tax=Dyella mobilis TaxID=1849582 RepID=A0ABS2KMT3_9GAMM|nr:FAD-binding dehydrogenase [Dyella mobilis]MBM7132419.1 FAD-binding dehydrogenase [Dyella mobilis]GLQ95593.1 FAD-binding dehydrogenase [Dyella mobilis]